jgi:hypothetical protein
MEKEVVYTLEQSFLWQKDKVFQAEETLKRMRAYIIENNRVQASAERNIKEVSFQLTELRTKADVVLLSEYARLTQELESWKTSLETLKQQTVGFKHSEEGAEINLKIEQKAFIHMQKEVESRKRVLEFKIER